MKFANLIIEGVSKIRNYGDDIQLYSIKLLYEYMGIDYREVVRLPLEELFSYDGEEYLILPINYPFWGGQYHPISPKIIPVYLGLAMFAGTKENIEALRLKEYEPVGCRDQKTFEVMQKFGIDAYLNGCMTITLPKMKEVNRNGKVFIVDVCKEFLDFIPSPIKDDAVYKTHVFLNRIVKEEESLSQYAQYQKEAKLVITSRLHCAVPCIAYGIPIIYAPKRNSSRSAWLQKIIPVYDKELWKNIDWEPKSVDIEELKKKVLENAADRIRETWKKYSLRCSITETYEDKALYGKMMSDDMFVPLEYMNKNWKQDDAVRYIIWGLTQTADTLYEYISEHYKRAVLVGFIDMYRKIQFRGIISEGIELLERERDAVVFVAAEAAQSEAIQIFNKMNRTNYVMCMKDENLIMPTKEKGSNNGLDKR